jgi:hypothetical protein
MGIVQIGSVSGVGQDVTAGGAAKVDTRQAVSLVTEGSYRMGVTTGDMAAGLAAAAPILEFRNANTAKSCILHSVSVCAASNGTGFAAGIAFFNLFKLRTHTVIATGGGAVAMTTAMGRQQSTQSDPGALIQLSATAALTIGSGATADTNAVAQAGPFTVGTATLTNFTLGVANLYTAGEFPLILAPNEGFTIRATVPATGVWVGKINLHWSEVTV